jgi:hypothetical protein
MSDSMYESTVEDDFYFSVEPIDVFSTAYNNNKTLLSIKHIVVNLFIDVGCIYKYDESTGENQPFTSPKNVLHDYKQKIKHKNITWCNIMTTMCGGGATIDDMFGDTQYIGVYGVYRNSSNNNSSYKMLINDIFSNNWYKQMNNVCRTAKLTGTIEYALTKSFDKVASSNDYHDVKIDDVLYNEPSDIIKNTELFRFFSNNDKSSIVVNDIMFSNLYNQG